MRDITLEETIYVNFTTRAFATGVPTTLAGSPVLSVLESNNATPITAGVSVDVDRASVAGLNQATVVATAANGYEAGKSYAVYISTGTVGGVSVVGEVVAQFTVQASAAFTRIGAPTGASVSADIAAVKSDTAATLIDTAEIGVAGAGLTALASASDLAALDGKVDTGNATLAKLDDTLEDQGGGIYGFTAAALQEAPSGGGGGPSASEIADAVWQEALADHSGTSGSTAEALAAAGGAGDPWITPLPGSYTSGQAGKIVGDFLDAAISSRASQAAVDDLPTNVELAAALDDIPTATENADALLNRDMAAVSDTNARSPLNALRHVRNKWDTTSNPGFVTVHKEDDITEAWRAALSTDSGAEPITGSDPT